MTSAAHGHDRGAIAAALYEAPAYDAQLPPLGVPRLSINLTASPVTGGVDGERSRAFVAQRHSLFLTPAGTSTRWRKSSPSRHLNILVADLAAVARLPAGRFAHAFTRYTGRSPHQYLLSRRVEHATAMLRRGLDRLAEVAAACGFASQQHMTRVLRARVGMTPAALRGARSVPRKIR